MSESQINLNYVIDEVFPCPIYIVDNCCNHLLEDLEEASKKEIEEYSLKTGVFFVDSTHTSFKQLNYYPFDALKQFIEYHSLIFLDKQGYDTSNIELKIQMWCNLSKEGGFLFPHTHAGSMLSGVFYVKTSSEDRIMFYNTQKLISNIVRPANPNRISSEQINYRCIPGTLLIWNSDLLHGNPRRECEDEKIAISFNTHISVKQEEIDQLF